MKTVMTCWQKKTLVQRLLLLYLLTDHFGMEIPQHALKNLQLLEPGKHTWLLKTLYGLLMLLPQQSAAFKILRTRLKTVPFSENLKRTSSANPYSQILQVTEDGNRNQDMQNYSAINFPFLLQQFENMQLQHRNHLKDQLQSRKSASTLTLSQVFSAFAHIFDYAIYMI
ncbi:Protein VAC14-like protein [Zea mays]|uniref:Protein VAC14-like protein n=1 Tax=Zea mays TaxID=4577 RepID=A0A1D6PGP4_MAIZE|nr:Protein VAC14-like protein [Zea mays]